VRHGELGTAEHVDDVERARGLRRLGDSPERRDSEDAPLVRVDGHAIEALLNEVPEDAERRPALRRRRPDDRDSPRRAEDRRDLDVIGDRDRPAVLFQVEEVDRPLSSLSGGVARLVVAQVAPSLTYG
jgi:hypothetical protein